jgi:hypothetical protein
MHVFNFQFVVTGDLSAVQGSIRSGLEAEGFDVAATGDGGFRATHGSAAKTMFLGVRTPIDDQREVLDVSFAAEDGSVQVDLHRPVFQAGGSDDNAIEQVRLHAAYKTTMEGLRDRLQAEGTLVSASI